MKNLFIAWQNTQTREWKSVACLRQCEKGFSFFYTAGAKAAEHFIPFGRMNKLEQVYRSKDLFPVFKNRLLGENRPEFKDFLNWLDLDESTYDQLDALALTEGKRGTDSLEIFPCPEKAEDGMYRISFFSHGLRHVNNGTKVDLDSVKEGDAAFLMQDKMNPFDPLAIAVRSNDPASLLGYCPRYLKQDLNWLLDNQADKISLTVQKVNKNAPIGLRLLFSLETPWDEAFKPCSGGDYEPIPNPELLTADCSCTECRQNF
ncbi:MAG: HIRAN domain-containing protein [Halodesulfovibrio sp.]|uniref:HIRAN domain-containing protein n=1 Tax=Halodesulfovibrio sp. TaxID=1912772 RepID=UPI00359D1EA3